MKGGQWDGPWGGGTDTKIDLNTWLEVEIVKDLALAWRSLIEKPF